MTAHEVNFDGLVGPTHNYAGLSYGNIASTTHKLSASSPRQAAMQGLEKMRFLHAVGLKQAVLPPQERPHLPTLRSLGFVGSDAEILDRVFREDPTLLAAVSSSSSMWAANAATVSPGADTADGRVHFTPANLITQFHRSIEPPTTTRILRAVFHDGSAFVVHDPLPAAAHFSDEGAANHTRLCADYGQRGIEVFTHGRVAFDPSADAPTRYPARQTFESGAVIARRHGLSPAATVHCRQLPAAIEAGAFHNDVVAVGNRDVLFMHELAIVNRDAVLDDIRRRFASICGSALRVIVVPAEAVSLDDAVSSYLFNSQLVSLPDGQTALVAPAECRDNPHVFRYITHELGSTPIRQVHFVNVRQSMQNGGGPACLRLRVVLNDEQLGKMHRGVLYTPELHDRLVEWITKHYRDHLEPADLRDPKLPDESRAALDELTRILGIGKVYEFQMK